MVAFKQQLMGSWTSPKVAPRTVHQRHWEHQARLGVQGKRQTAREDLDERSK